MKLPALLRILGWMRRTAVHDNPSQGLLFGNDWRLGDERPTSSSRLPLPPAKPATAAAEEAPPAAQQPPAYEQFSPQSFLHPATARKTRLAGHVVGYAFTRAKRRSIGMVVGAEGLSVRAPRWVTLNDVEEALQERAQWIVKHLKDYQSQAEQAQATRIVWRDGTTVNYLGEPLVVVLNDSITGAALEAANDISGDEAADSPQTTTNAVARRILRVGLRHDATPDAIRDTVHAWLQREARRLFEARCQHYAGKLGVTVKRLSLSAARTRWGSAGSDGSVRLNWRLIHYGLPCIDYVVVHELSHLRHMNHSPAFWRVVASAMPDYECAKLLLSQQHQEPIRD